MSYWIQDVLPRCSLRAHFFGTSFATSEAGCAPHKGLRSPRSTFRGTQCTISKVSKLCLLAVTVETFGRRKCGVRDPRTTCGDPRTTCGDPRTTCGDPGTTCGDPRTTCGDPRTTCGDPRTTGVLVLEKPGVYPSTAIAVTMSEPPAALVPGLN